MEGQYLTRDILIYKLVPLLPLGTCALMARVCKRWAEWLRPYLYAEKQAYWPLHVIYDLFLDALRMDAPFYFCIRSRASSGTRLTVFHQWHHKFNLPGYYFRRDPNRFEMQFRRGEKWLKCIYYPFRWRYALEEGLLEELEIMWSRTVQITAQLRLSQQNPELLQKWSAIEFVRVHRDQRTIEVCNHPFPSRKPFFSPTQ